MSTAHTGLGVSLRSVARVHVAISRAPAASVRELARTTRLGTATVRAALAALTLAGYIEQRAYASRARRVLIPAAPAPRRTAARRGT